MTPENFVYWLNGYLELAVGDNDDIPSPAVKSIKEHLALVLNKVTPEVIKFKGDIMQSRPLIPTGKIC
jgi:hypothetical protein